LIGQFQLGSTTTRVSIVGFGQIAPYDAVKINGFRSLIDFSDDIAALDAVINQSTSAGT
jgi:hypothetical protein